MQDAGQPIDFDAEWFQCDPWPLYASMRQRSPVWHSAADGCDYVFSHRAVHEVLTSTSFTAAFPFRGTRQLFGPTMIDLDGPEHRRLRSPLVPALRPSAIAALAEQLIDPAVEDVVADLPAHGVVDLMPALAEQIPPRVGARLLGLPKGAGPALYQAIRPIVQYLDAPAGQLEAAYQARESLEQTLGPLVAEARPPDHAADLAHRLTGAVDARAALINLVVLAVAVMETTVRGLGNTLIVLARHPDHLAALRDDPEGIDAAVAEATRLEPPLHFIFRHAATTTILEGVEIPEHAPVQLCLASANRDEVRFEHPDRFMPERRERTESLTFGWGPHGCVGAYLARREIATAVRALLERYGGWRLVGEPVIRGRYFRSPTAVDARLP